MNKIIMKNLNIIFCVILLFPVITFSQMGIGTDLPKSTLDVNGNLNIKNQLYLGGTDNSLGNPGVNGQIVVSNGDNPATWQDVRLPEGISTLTISSKYVKDDEIGVSLTNGVTTAYQEDSNLSTWSVIENLNTSFNIVNITNKVNFSVQTIVQRSNSDLASYACGIFIDDKLKAVRTDIINTTAGGYKTYNINITLDNIGVGNHTAKFACRGRNIASGSLGIGKVINATYLSAAMAKSVFKTTILERM
ncbi:MULTISPECIES: hypothetical protein [Weeksellaceae]|uniref:hypothetical protein n=1 Tax=Weeksellaceae TaxID=2762318 RepID=UPI0025C59B5C|nr:MULTISPECIES: hypothetical protein [Weeksellaceae]